MRWIGNLRCQPCRYIRAQQTLSQYHHQTRFPLSWRPEFRIAGSLERHSRGKKTQSTIQLQDLPQGALPALPPDDNGNVPIKTYPPVLQQHLDNVKKYSDCVVLTRVGDFYEMYFNQVEEYAPLVNLKKAKRNTALGDVPMAGFQHTQLERYLKMFVLDLGKPVAISEQVPIPPNERAAKAGGPMFDRKVNRIVTAGTLVDESFLNAYENNYLLSINFGDASQTLSKTLQEGDVHRQPTKIGLSWVDLSNGDFFTQESDLAFLPSLIARIDPREIVLDPIMESTDNAHLLRLFGEGKYSIHFQEAPEIATSIEQWTPMLERPLSVQEQQKFAPLEVGAGSLVLDYVKDKLLDMQIQLQPPIQRLDNEYMSIDKQSLRGLEIRTTLRDGHFEGSLLHSSRKTVTQSGARLLSQRLVSPSLSLSVINHRLDLVEEMLHQHALREDIIALLKRTSDTLRLLQRFSIGKGDADDLLGLARTIDVTSQISALLRDCASDSARPSPQSGVEDAAGCLLYSADRLDLGGPAKVAKAIIAAIDEEGLSRQHSVEDEARAAAEGMSAEVENADATGEKTPRLVRRASIAKGSAGSSGSDNSEDEIWIMRKHASPTLERAHDGLKEVLDAKAELAQRLRSELQADSLTLKWSGGLGHHCHVKGKDTKRSLSGLSGARETGSSKSTKTFYYTEWTHLGARIEDAKLRIRSEEERVFRKLRAQVIENLMKLRRNAMVLDELDVACSSATVAKERNLIRPIVTNTTSHRIIGGRHPTVDIGLQSNGRQFTANDCLVGDAERIYLITGPNMAGKSTYLRQNALITILAQTGCFVPATYAEIGLVDKIFSRVGSADNLYQDQSTFMVEMLETAAILKQATPRSFVIMDEVGRGTTPEDGLAVAYACLHHLDRVNGCRTLFATHFHALATLTQEFERLACFCTDVAEEEDGRWSYVHRLRRGVNLQSHALKVAELAGMPKSAIAVAEGMVAELTAKKKFAASTEKADEQPIAAESSSGT